MVDARSGFFRVGREAAFRLPEAVRDMLVLPRVVGERYSETKQQSNVCSA